MDYWWWLIPIGFAVGLAGTLIGAGGGFLLMPFLLLVYPHQSPELLTAISLAIVFCNAGSGSVAYARMKRIDYRAGLWFALAATPGAVIGAFVVDWIPRRAFNIIFGAVLLAAAVYLLIRPGTARRTKGVEGGAIAPAVGVDPPYSLKLGMSLSFFVGILSSLLGIGGGIIHVPALIQILDFPVHIATATSHFVLAITALVATIVHLGGGVFSQGSLWQTLMLAIGVVPGAQVGAKLSSHVKGSWIVRGLATALGVVGLRLLLKAV